MCSSPARARAVLVPVVGYLFVLLGVYAYPDSEVGPTWAFTSLACCALTAWLVGALLGAEPGPQAEIATAALGGWSRRARLESAVVGVVAGAQRRFPGLPGICSVAPWLTEK